MTIEKDNSEIDQAIFRNLINKSNAAIFVNDPHTGLFIFVNDKACAILGYDRQDLLKMSVMDIKTPFFNNFSWQTHVNELQQKGSLMVEGRHKRENGTTFPVTGNISYVVLDTGEYIVAVFPNVTEQKRAEEVPTESEAPFKELFENAADAIFIADVDSGLIVDANQAASRLMLLPHDKIVGLHQSRLHPPEKDKYSKETFEKHKEDAKQMMPTHPIENTLLRSDGVEVPVEVLAAMVTVKGKKLIMGTFRDITERRRAEEEVRMLKHSIDVHYDGAYWMDNDNKFVYVNDAGCKALGYTREELIGKTIGEVNPMSSAESMRNVWARLRGGKSFFAESVHRRKDGSEFPVEIATTYVQFGGREYACGFARDITERKRTEETLQLTRFTVDNVADAIYWMNLKAQIVDVNETACNMLGYTRDEFLNLTVLDIDPDFTAERWATAWETLKGQGKLTIETKHRTKDGRIIPVEIMANYLSFGGTELDCAFARDISQRKRAEEELREKEGKYRVLFESANDGIFIQDEIGFTDCNQKGAEMYGLPKEEIIGRLPREFAPERQPDGRLSSEVAGEKTRAALSGVPQVFEWQPVRADGSPFDVEVTLSRLELGGKIYLQAIVRDITERKRLEQEILRGQKLEAIGMLAGGIAHDFNNLLQGVFGYISMAKLTHDQKEKSLAMLEQAEEALHMSVNLTTQLLTFSKGGKPIKKKMILQPIIENAARFALSGSGVDYRIEFDSGLWAVEVDEGQISQVIQNIVINADQAMPEGGTVVITAKNVVEPDKNHTKIPNGNYVAISIQDTGIGIPGQYLQKIFDPYFTTKEKGSGLGLATSYSIMRNHGGFIDVISELGKGTTFFIYLPAAVEAEEEISETTTVSSAVRKGKILVMDDENMIRNIARELIMALGHEVDLAEHGDIAIEKYQTARESGKPFDVVILDLTVRGGMGGRETIERLRVIDPGVKAIVSSGYSDDTVVADYEKYGFKARLTKPYKIDSLRYTLNALLS